MSYFDYIDHEAWKPESTDLSKRTITFWADVDDDGGQELVTLNCRWAICDYCEGEGGHSRHLGAISQETLDDWDWEQKEEYFSGGYDMKCEYCDHGKVLEPDPDRNPAELMKLYERTVEEHERYEQERRHEIRMGY